MTIDSGQFVLSSKVAVEGPNPFAFLAEQGLSKEASDNLNSSGNPQVAFSIALDMDTLYNSLDALVQEGLIGEQPLSLEEITSIVDLLLTSLNKRLADRKVSIEFTNAAKQWIGEKGYDPTYGARPLKRFLQKQVETQLARALVAGDVVDGSTVSFSVKADQLIMKIN